MLRLLTVSLTLQVSLNHYQPKDATLITARRDMIDRRKEMANQTAGISAWGFWTEYHWYLIKIELLRLIITKSITVQYEDMIAAGVIVLLIWSWGGRWVRDTVIVATGESLRPASMVSALQGIGQPPLLGQRWSTQQALVLWADLVICPKEAGIYWLLTTFFNYLIEVFQLDDDVRIWVAWLAGSGKLSVSRCLQGFILILSATVWKKSAFESHFTSDLYSQQASAFICDW